MPRHGGGLSLFRAVLRREGRRVRAERPLVEVDGPDDAHIGILLIQRVQLLVFKAAVGEDQLLELGQIGDEPVYLGGIGDLCSGQIQLLDRAFHTGAVDVDLPEKRNVGEGREQRVHLRILGTCGGKIHGFERGQERKLRRVRQRAQHGAHVVVAHDSAGQLDGIGQSAVRVRFGKGEKGVIAVAAACVEHGKIREIGQQRCVVLRQSGERQGDGVAALRAGGERDHPEDLALRVLRTLCLVVRDRQRFSGEIQRPCGFGDGRHVVRAGGKAKQKQRGQKKRRAVEPK